MRCWQTSRCVPPEIARLDYEHCRWRCFNVSDDVTGHSPTQIGGTLLYYVKTDQHNEAGSWWLLHQRHSKTTPNLEKLKFVYEFFQQLKIEGTAEKTALITMVITINGNYHYHGNEHRFR